MFRRQLVSRGFQKGKQRFGDIGGLFKQEYALFAADRAQEEFDALRKPIL